MQLYIVEEFFINCVKFGTCWECFFIEVSEISELLWNLVEIKTTRKFDKHLNSNFRERINMHIKYFPFSLKKQKINIFYLTKPAS